MVTTNISARTKALLSTIAATAAGFAAIYVTLGGGDNTSTRKIEPKAAAVAQQDGGASSATTAKRLSVGEMTTFVFKPQREALAEVAFKNSAGDEISLKSWHGRVVLLNLWATWCAPCRKEMPALDRLQKDLGSQQFEVVALAVDRAGADAAAKFLAGIEVRNLGLYVDQTARGATALKAVGMPTTILIDRDGREVGRLTGPAEWDSEDAKRLIKSLL